MDADEHAIRKMLQEGFCCSQIIVRLGLSLRGEENEAMVTAASGLCLGLYSGRTCGTLSAACLVLALFDRKNAAEHMIPRLMEWYEETYDSQYGGASCQDITGGKLHPGRCTDILVRTWRTVKELLGEFGFDVRENSPA